MYKKRTAVRIKAEEYIRSIDVDSKFKFYKFFGWGDELKFMGEIDSLPYSHSYVLDMARNGGNFNPYGRDSEFNPHGQYFVETEQKLISIPDTEALDEFIIHSTAFGILMTEIDRRLPEFEEEENPETIVMEILAKEDETFDRTVFS